MASDQLQEAETAYYAIIDHLLLNLHASHQEWGKHEVREKGLLGLPTATRRYREALRAAVLDQSADESELTKMQAESLVTDTAHLLSTLTGHRQRQGLQPVSEP